MLVPAGLLEPVMWDFVYGFLRNVKSLRASDMANRQTLDFDSKPIDVAVRVTW